MPKLDVERAVETIQMVMGGGKPASVDDITLALAVVGQSSEALLKRIVELGRADIAWSFVTQLAVQLPPPAKLEQHQLDGVAK